MTSIPLFGLPPPSPPTYPASMGPVSPLLPQGQCLGLSFHLQVSLPVPQGHLPAGCSLPSLTLRTPLTAQASVFPSKPRIDNAPMVTQTCPSSPTDMQTHTIMHTWRHEHRATQPFWASQLMTVGWPCRVMSTKRKPATPFGWEREL